MDEIPSPNARQSLSVVLISHNPADVSGTCLRATANRPGRGGVASLQTGMVDL